MAATSKRRVTTLGPAWSDVSELGEPVGEPIWLEPYPSGEPEGRYEKIENIGIAYAAALQYLPASQRAVLILRDVLRFSAAETADMLGTSVAAVNSSLQRARRVIGDGLPAADTAPPGELVANGWAGVSRGTPRATRVSRSTRNEGDMAWFHRHDEY